MRYFMATGSRSRQLPWPIILEPRSSACRNLRSLCRRGSLLLSFYNFVLHFKNTFFFQILECMNGFENFDLAAFRWYPVQLSLEWFESNQLDLRDAWYKQKSTISPLHQGSHTKQCSGHVTCHITRLSCHIVVGHNQYLDSKNILYAMTWSIIQ